LNNDVFKKPLLPKKNIEKIPKPEKLTHWYDDQHDFGMWIIYLYFIKK